MTVTFKDTESGICMSVKTVISVTSDEILMKKSLAKCWTVTRKNGKEIKTVVLPKKAYQIESIEK